MIDQIRYNNFTKALSYIFIFAIMNLLLANKNVYSCNGGGGGSAYTPRAQALVGFIGAYPGTGYIADALYAFNTEVFADNIPNSIVNKESNTITIAENKFDASNNDAKAAVSVCHEEIHIEFGPWSETEAQSWGPIAMIQHETMAIAQGRFCNETFGYPDANYTALSGLDNIDLLNSVRNSYSDPQKSSNYYLYTVSDAEWNAFINTQSP